MKSLPSVQPRLKAILAERDMRQVELQELSGVSQVFISRFDSTKLHQVKHLVAISRALGVSIEDLFHIEE